MKKTTLALSIALSLSGLLAQPARALTVMVIKGTVSDALGRGVAAARVSDGAQQSTLTDASGNYEIDESSLATYSVTVSKVGLIPASKRVGPTDALDPVNFSVIYSIAGSLSSWALSTANGPASATLTATEYVPLPGTPDETGGYSCVYVTDARTSATWASTLVSTDGAGRSTWNYELSLSQGTPDGSYLLSFEVRDCSSSTVLSTRGEVNYMIDSVPPALALIAPFDNGNTYLTSERIVIEARDFRKATHAELQSGVGLPAGSGIDPSTISVSLQDVGLTEAAQVPANTYDPGAQLIRTNAAALTRGLVYQVSMGAHDFAGNSTSVSARFSVLMADPTTSNARAITTRITTIAPTSSQSTSGVAATDTYTWLQVPVTVGGFTASVRDTFHPGAGTIAVEIPTGTAVVNYTLGGISGPPVHPREATSSVKVRFATDGRGAVDFAVASQAPLVGSLTALVPKGASNVTLSLDSTATSTSFPLCSDPTTQSGCAPDPIPTFECPSCSPYMSLANGSPCNGSYQGTVTGTQTWDYEEDCIYGAIDRWGNTYPVGEVLFTATINLASSGAVWEQSMSVESGPGLEISLQSNCVDEHMLYDTSCSNGWKESTSPEGQWIRTWWEPAATYLLTNQNSYRFDYRYRWIPEYYSTLIWQYPGDYATQPGAALSSDSFECSWKGCEYPIVIQS